MKFVIICLVAAALVLAEAGYVSNKKCPTVSSIPYQSEMATRTLHRALYVDSTTYSYINQLSKVTPASKGLNMTCLNDGTYGFSAAQYAYWYQNATGPLAMNFLYFDPTTATSFFYDCIDQSKLSSLLAYVAAETGLALPQAVVSSISKLLAFGRFDVFIVTSSVTSLSTSIIDSMTTAVKTQIPSFTMKSMTAFNQNGC